MTKKIKTWYLIPVRRGSRAIPGKNVRLLAGKPLLLHVLSTLLTIESAEQIFILTDSDEVAYIVKPFHIQLIQVKEQSGLETLDEKALESLPFLRKHGAKDEDIFITIQATCPFLNSKTILQANKLFSEGANSVITVIDDRHLFWSLDEQGNPKPAYKNRVNRQQLPPHYQESGAIIGTRIKWLAKYKTRIVAPTRLLEISKDEGLDIDDFSDWGAAEIIANRQKIIIRADANKNMGMGHIYRCLAISQELVIRHDVIIVCDNEIGNLGLMLLEKYPFRVEVVSGNEGFIQFVQKEKPYLIILDQLDTNADYVRTLKKYANYLISFEDSGDGALEADFVINDLYQHYGLCDKKQLVGLNNAIISPSFDLIPPKEKVIGHVKNIFILFGGTDPSNLTIKALKALQIAKFQGTVTVVHGLGHNHIVCLDDYQLKGETYRDVIFLPKLMAKADLALSSAGRTITELLWMCIPTLCICQNEKELSHTHATSAQGVLNIGLGKLIDEQTLANHIQFLIENTSFRQQMATRAMHAITHRDCNKNILKRILKNVNLTL